MKEMHVNIGSGIALCLLALFLNGQLDGVPIEGVIMPRALLILLALCGVGMALQALIQRKQNRLEFFGDLDIKKFLTVISIYVVSVVCCLYVSFYLTMFLMCMGVTTFLSEEKTKRVMAVNVFFSAGALVFIYLFFTLLMNVPFPEPLFA